MGKNKRAAKAAWRAAATAAIDQQTSSTSTEPSLVAAVTPAAPADAHDSRASTSAPTQQQHDVHAQNACPAPHAPSIASCTATTSSDGASSSSSSSPPPSATERERRRRPAATIGDPRKDSSVDTHTAAPTASPASHTSPVSSSNTSTRCSNTTRPRAAENESEEGFGPGEEEVRTLALPASRTQATTPRASHTPPPSTTRPRAAKNESNGLVGARKDHAHTPPPRTTSHAPPSTQRDAPSTHRDVPALAHYDMTPPTPGFEPGEPHTAAASEPYVEPALLDASQVEELVATALSRGHETGLKEGRNVGFREGLEAGKRTGVAEGREEGLMEGIELGRLEVSTTPSAPPPHDAPYEARSINDIHPDLLDVIMRQGERRGLKDGKREGRKEGREDGFREGLEAGKRMGTMEGREQGFREGKVTGLQDGYGRAREEVRRIPHTSVMIQTEDARARTLVDSTSQTECVPTAPRPPMPTCIEFAVQTEPPIEAANCIYADVHNDQTETKKTETHSKHDIPTAKAHDLLHDPPPLLVGQDRHTCANVNHCINPVTSVDNIPSASFSWADDADVLPISSVPPLPMQRDFSVLRSSTTASPFGSLQRRARRAHRSSLPRPWSRPVVPPAPVVTRRHPAGLRSGKPSFTQVSSHSGVDSGVLQSAPLDWDGDPRLAELSWVLRSLGWVQSAVP